MLYSPFWWLKSIDSKLAPVFLAFISLFLLATPPLFFGPDFLLPVNAQAIEVSEAEGDRLFQQGLQQLETRQFSAAVNSLQQALKIYRTIKNRQREGVALANVGVAYISLGDYAKAIEYSQQYLALAREMAPIAFYNKSGWLRITRSPL